MTPYSPLLAQIDFAGIVSGINAQFGALASLFTLIVIFLVLIYRNQESANNQKDKEDVRRDNLISNLAEQSTKLETELRETVKAQYQAEGRATAYEKQIQFLQEKFDAKELERTKEYRKLKNAYLRIDKRLKDLGLDLQKEKEENFKLNEALTNALVREKKIQTQLDESEALRAQEAEKWRKEKYDMETTIHQLHEDIRAMKEATMPLNSPVLDALDVTESDKEHSSKSNEDEQAKEKE